MMDHNNLRVKNAMQSVDLIGQTRMIIMRLKVLSASHHAKPKMVMRHVWLLMVPGCVSEQLVSLTASIGRKCDINELDCTRR